MLMNRNSNTIEIKLFILIIILLPAFHLRARDEQAIQVHTLGGPRQLHALARNDLTRVNIRGHDCRFNAQKIFFGQDIWKLLK
jgi:hypothetical protein